MKRLVYFASALLMIFNIACSDSKNTKVEESKKEPVIAPPFADIQIQKENYTLDPSKDTVLSYKTGSEIVVPQNAFVDKNGNVVKDKVKLSYREFTNAFDIYLGGVPMTIDSAGDEMVFETAGMIEINASANEKPVYVNQNNKITVKMNSFETGDNYNIYQLDTTTGKWTETGQSTAEVQDYNEEIKKLPYVPKPPRQAGQFAFSIGDETGNFPELDMYENVMFESVDNQHCGHDATEIKVEDAGNGIYEITFIFEGYGVRRENTCRCYPVFKKGEDYDKAIQKYQKKYASLIAKREKMKQELEQAWEKYSEALKRYPKAVFNSNIDSYNENEKITRALQISGFGFVNCDRPTSYPKGAELIAKFTDKKGNAIKVKNLTLAVVGRNAIFRYKDKIRFNPQQDNIMWGVTSDGMLAYFKIDDFKKMDRRKGNYTFDMTVHNEKLTSYNDIRDVLFKN